MSSALVTACLALPIALVLYILYTFISLLIRQAMSPLRKLSGPPSPSFFMGNLREIHDQENTNLVAWDIILHKKLISSANVLIQVPERC